MQAKSARQVRTFMRGGGIPDAGDVVRIETQREKAK